MLTELLFQFGLTDKETAAYIALLRLGARSPTEISQQLHIPRTTAQNILIRLHQKDLIQTLQRGKKLCYEAIHPEVLKFQLKTKKQKAVERFDAIEKTYDAALPELISMLYTNKSLPQVRFFKGKQGAREVLFDTLTSKTELKDFANIDAMFNVFKDVNDEYVAKREKTKITKRSLLLDTPFARSIYESGSYSPKSHKGYKWIPSDLYKFSIEMNIYDGKISYLTYIEEELIGVIIENQYIYETHNALWNLLWDLLK